MNVGLALLTLFPGRAGGAETYVRGLVGAFAAGDGPEKTTALVNRQSERALRELASPQLEFQLVDSYRPGDSRVTRLLAMEAARLRTGRIARDVPSDINLIHYPVTVPIPKLKAVPRVVSLLDLQHHDLPKMFSPAERSFRRWAYDRAAREANEVITISEFSAERISSQLGIGRERIHVIHLGIDHARFAPDGPSAEIPGLPQRYIFYPANQWPHKNHELLLKAFERVDDPELHLVLSGQAASQSSHSAAAGRVIRLGHVDADQVAGLYRGAEALIFPSLYEGFGLPPLEAMACGCPVAASDLTAISEVCGDAALLFDPTDADAIAAAIKQVTTDGELRDRLRQAGTQQAAQFTWAKAAHQHLEVYEAALGLGGNSLKAK